MPQSFVHADGLLALVNFAIVLDAADIPVCVAKGLSIPMTSMDSLGSRDLLHLREHLIQRLSANSASRLRP